MTSKTINGIIITENATFSKKVREMLGMSLHTWENLMVASLVSAALAAAFVGVATFAVVRLQRVELAASKDEFERYKLGAGIEIAKAGEGAAKANLELERLRAPRTLSVKQQSRMMEKLKVFQGTKFGIVVHAWQDEPATFKSMLLGTLVRSGWDVDIQHQRAASFRLSPGVVVSVGFVTPPRINDPAQALVESLTSEGFDARLEYGNVTPKNIDIEIQIGTKH